MFPISANQSTIWFERQLFPAPAVNNGIGYTYIKGHIDKQLLRKAFDILTAQQTNPLTLTTAATTDSQDDYPVQLLQLASGNPSHVCILLEQSSTSYYLYTGNTGISVSRLRALYENLLSGASPAGDMYVPAQETYWLEQFPAEAPVLSLPNDFPQPAQPSFQRQTVHLAIPETCRKQLQQHASPDAIMLTALFAALYKYTGQEDIVVGVPAAAGAGATPAAANNTFVNLLPVRAFPSGKTAFSELLANVSYTCGQALRHKDYPFDQLTDKLRPQHPLFDVMFAVGASLPAAQDYGYCDVLLETDYSSLQLTYNTDLFLPATAGSLLQHYTNILTAALALPEQPLAAIPMLSPAEEQWLLTTCNDTLAAYPEDKCIHHFFDEQANAFPDNTALIWNNEEMTYGVLQAKANQVAASIQAVMPDTRDRIIAVLLDRSPDMIAALLGILKAGAAYLPIDPDYPADRIQYMLEDSGAAVLMTRSDIPALPYYNGHTICTDQLKEAMPFRQVAIQPQDLAYIIYTSGSTGKPKGVMIEHRNVVRLLFNEKDLFDFSAADTWTLFHSYCFDFSVWEMYGALLFGGRLVIVSKAVAQHAGDFLQLLRQQRVTVLNQTPGAFYNLAAAALEHHMPLQLRYVIFGGEALKPGKLKAWQQQYPACRLINMYGITETTVHVTYKEITSKEIDSNASNIGKPIPTLSMVILDRDGRLMPRGSAGELCVGGAGLARGYLNRSALTAERFIPHPYIPGEKLYRTGDLAKMLPDADFEYLGRIDHQVKIRGFRIELGEIESKLLAHPAVSDVLVIDREDPAGDKYLCAYVATQVNITPTDLRQHLSAFLPDYMVPAFFLLMDSFPLTGNGKIDRKRLPEPREATIAALGYEAPVTDTELQLAALWMEILHVPQAGRHHHFFELGGHSLKAVKAINAILRTFGVSIPLPLFFRHAVLKEQAALIAQLQQQPAALIPAAPEQDYYPLSSSQQRFYLLHQLEGAALSYNLPKAFRVQGHIDIQRLEAAIQAMIRRHEILRTAFVLHDGLPVQVIQKEVPFAVGYTKIDIADEAQYSAAFIRTFDLASPPLLRAHYYDYGHDNGLFLFDMHHIVSDAVSNELFTTELLQLYQGTPLPPVTLQYKDFAVWQQNRPDTALLQEQENYWLQQFADEVPALSLPADFPRPAQQSFHGKREQLTLPAEVYRQLTQSCEQWGTTLHQLLMAAFSTLLYKYSGNSDIVIGVPAAGRTRAELENVMGAFINTLAIRTFPSGQQTFRELLSAISQTSAAGLRHQDYPFEQLIDKLQLKRDLSRHPLFDIMFSFLQEEKIMLPVETGSAQALQPAYHVSKFDLLLEAMQSDQSLTLSLEYSTGLFLPDTVQTLLQHYLQILTTVLTQPDQPLAAIPMLSPAEEQWLLTECNDTLAAYPEDKCIHHFFDEQANAFPDNTALIWNNEEMTYGVLQAKANQVAANIQAVMPDTRDRIIAVLLDRSPDMIAALLGILKAGAAYLPIDPDYPADRIQYMLEDSGAAVLMTRSDIPALPYYNGHTICTDQLPAAAAFRPVAVKPQDLAYIIYTSGSTGKPKGVMIEHRNVVRLFFNEKDLFDFSAADTWTLFHSYCFDFSVWEMYGALLFGGRLVIVSKAVAQHAGDFLQLLQQQRVTVLNQTPGAFYNLAAAAQEHHMPLQLRYVIFGGEALKPGKLKAWQQQYPACRLINMYGITETTVHVTYKEITSKEIDSNASNIGKPIPTLSMVILDRDGRLMPRGSAGELCVGGAGLARGYLNRSALTAERFIPHPYIPGEKLYRTGDLAKMLPDADFEYLGRIDHQVKIRGFRIELGEIESKLLAHPAVSDVLVIDREDPAGDKYLCAYVATQENITPTDLRQHLSAFLPDYMVPAFFLLMDSFPLTGNGKIDRKRLPEPQAAAIAAAGYEAPVTDTELQLAALWSKVLHVPNVSLHHHFFELGGHSLKAAQLSALIHKQFHVELPLREIFAAPAFRDMAARIAKGVRSAHHHIVPATPQAWYPASSAEKRLYIINQIDGAGISYNIPVVYALTGQPDLKRLTDALHLLVSRHEILRTAFDIRDNEVIQVVQEDVLTDIPLHECPADKLPDFINAFIQPFPLTAAPLLRAAIVKTDSDRYYLLLDLHHIIADGVAVSNLLQELSAAYNGDALPVLAVQTKDYAVWQQQWLQSAEARSARAFWKAQFEEETTLLNMPVDYVRPPVKSYDGAWYTFSIPATLSTAIKEISRANGATSFMLMLAAYNILLSRYSGQEDIITGTPVAGRSHADVQELLGMFVNTLPMRTAPAAEKRFPDFLREIKELSLRAFEHQDYPFEALLDDLDITRDMSRNPLFDYMFTYRADQGQFLQLADVEVSPVPVPRTISKMDLTLEIHETEDGELSGGIEYATRIFAPDTITRFAAHYLEVLAQIAANPEIQLQHISIISAAEKEQILQFSHATGNAYTPFPEGEKDIYTLFEKRAAQYPDHIAVDTEKGTVTYRELEARVSRVAAVLQAAGAGPDKIIALCTERSVDMITGMLAILKAGAAYLPVDPDYPEERVRYMLDNSGALLVLTQQQLSDNLSYAANKIFIDALPAAVTAMPPVKRSPESLAYVIYTSGSTGKPKGVLIEHHSFYNSVLSNAGNYRNGFSAADVCLSLSNISFDASVLEIFIPLVHGARLVLVNREHVYDVKSLAAVITAKGVTFCYIPPSLLQPLYKTLRGNTPVSVNKLFVGVEPIKDTTLQQYISLNEKMEIVNAYGPTEAAVSCSWYRYQPGQPRGVYIPIGKPLRNARLYIVNEHMQLQPAGVPGELCIAGEGLARGYLHNPALTAEKFVDNPFEPGRKLYRTGDLAKWLPDGNIFFSGRKDHQVKIRGFRIEPGEIENKLMEHPEIKQALVIDKTDNGGNKYLCAYVISARQLDPALLRAHLGASLPAYMIPSFFIVMEKFPLTSNEKIDRKALPEPEINAGNGAGLTLPEDATESKLLHIWQTILESDQISTTDNFFTIGGNSLKIINMLSLLQQSFGDALKVSDLFDKPTIREQAAAVNRSMHKNSRQPSKAKRVEF
nr:non-ribosomal peptide synthetase [Chitinophaga solisilvae]